MVASLLYRSTVYNIIFALVLATLPATILQAAEVNGFDVSNLLVPSIEIHWGHKSELRRSAFARSYVPRSQSQHSLRYQGDSICFHLSRWSSHDRQECGKRRASSDQEQAKSGKRPAPRPVLNGRQAGRLIQADRLDALYLYL